MPREIIDRPRADEYAAYYARYVTKVPEGNLIDILTAQATTLERLLRNLDDARAGFTYAPGKWTVRQVVGHLIDTERVFTYRALSIARADPARLPSFDQDAWEPYGNFNARPLNDLLDEWLSVRDHTLTLVAGLPEDALDRRGIASDLEFTVRALLHIPPGHIAYHLEILYTHYRFKRG